MAGPTVSQTSLTGSGTRAPQDQLELDPHMTTPKEQEELVRSFLARLLEQALQAKENKFESVSRKNYQPVSCNTSILIKKLISFFCFDVLHLICPQGTTFTLRLVPRGLEETQPRSPVKCFPLLNNLTVSSFGKILFEKPFTPTLNH